MQTKKIATAFGVAAMAAVIGILLILLGIALRRLTSRRGPAH